MLLGSPESGPPSTSSALETLRSEPSDGLLTTPLPRIHMELEPPPSRFRA